MRSRYFARGPILTGILSQPSGSQDKSLAYNVHDYRRSLHTRLYSNGIELLHRFLSSSSGLFRCNRRTPSRGDAKPWPRAHHLDVIYGQLPIHGGGVSKPLMIVSGRRTRPSNALNTHDMNQFLVGDVVVIWRTWALWRLSPSKWPVWIPVVLWIASLGKVFPSFL